MKRTGLAALLAVLVGAAAPAPPPLPSGDLVLNCYLTQSGELGLGQFVRQLVVRPDRGVVSVADGVNGAPPQFVGNGRLVTLDAARLVFDFASPRSAGRTEVDLRSGALMFQGGRAVVRGSCQRSEL